MWGIQMAGSPNLTFRTLSNNKIIVPNLASLLERYRKIDGGYDYHKYDPSSDPDALVLEDLAVTLAINSLVGWRAAVSVVRLGANFDQLRQVSQTPLPDCSTVEIDQICRTILALVQDWDGFGVSVATK